jgi:hypothetical protein
MRLSAAGRGTGARLCLAAVVSGLISLMNILPARAADDVRRWITLDAACRVDAKGKVTLDTSSVRTYDVRNWKGVETVQICAASSVCQPLRIASFDVACDGGVAPIADVFMASTHRGVDRYLQDQGRIFQIQRNSKSRRELVALPAGYAPDVETWALTERRSGRGDVTTYASAGNTMASGAADTTGWKAVVTPTSEAPPRDLMHLIAGLLVASVAGLILSQRNTTAQLAPLLARARRLLAAAHTPALTANNESAVVASGEQSLQYLESTVFSAWRDPVSGLIDGKVVAGPWQGETIGDLATLELYALWRDVRDDAASCSILEAVLDRRQPTWRERIANMRSTKDAGTRTAEERAPMPPPADMSVDEALDILGFKRGSSPDREELSQRFRELAKRLHPDRGGSEHLIKQVNAARDILESRYASSQA